MQDPVGFWDPAGGAFLCNICVVGRLVTELAAGFTADGSVENFKRRRQTELKHGRMGCCKSYVGVLDASGLHVLNRWSVVVLLLLWAFGFLPEWHAPLICDPIAGSPCWPPWVTLPRSNSRANMNACVSCTGAACVDDSQMRREGWIMCLA